MLKKFIKYIKNVCDQKSTNLLPDTYFANNNDLVMAERKITGVKVTIPVSSFITFSVW